MRSDTALQGRTEDVIGSMRGAESKLRGQRAPASNPSERATGRLAAGAQRRLAAAGAIPMRGPSVMAQDVGYNHQAEPECSGGGTTT